MNWPEFLIPPLYYEVLDQRSYRDVTAGDGVVKFKNMRWWWMRKDFHSIEAWLRDGGKCYVREDESETHGATTMSLKNESIFLLEAPTSCIEVMVHAYPNGNHDHGVTRGRYYALHRFLLL
jgi:hypothetical protein